MVGFIKLGELLYNKRISLGHTQETVAAILDISNAFYKIAQTIKQ